MILSLNNFKEIVLKILKFSADWCQPCKILARNIDESNLSLKVESIDVDKQPDAAVKYGIRSVPTLVIVDDNDEIVSRSSGVKTGEQIQEWVNANV